MEGNRKLLLEISVPGVIWGFCMRCIGKQSRRELIYLNCVVYAEYDDFLVKLCMVLTLNCDDLLGEALYGNRRVWEVENICQGFQRPHLVEE